MSKCGKGCMPECEYFTTGGCISPFNCPYKIETGYINTTTSIPTYMEQYNGMNDDVIKRLTAENADLHERLKEAEHRAEVAERQAILLSKWLAEKTRKDYPWQARFDEAQKQAEKEFAEEDKR